MQNIFWEQQTVGQSYPDNIKLVDSRLVYSLSTCQRRSNHPCYRPCKEGDHRVCNYVFHIEWFKTLTNTCYNCPQVPQDCFRHDCIPGDGFERMVQVVNLRIPGPKIELCEGDEISVQVHNDMFQDSTSIHWHGQHQKGSPFMDGVPFVTQCPINPKTSFKYYFTASEAGTHFWHSHTGLQRGNGLAGPLVVRRRMLLERNLYDFDLSEHIIFVQDWTENEVKRVYIERYFNHIVEMPRSLLVNGLGRFIDKLGNTRGVPAPRFVVAAGRRYRFRLIGSMFMDTPFLFSIDQHRFTVIATDGVDIQPEPTDILTILAGERYDIVVHANQTSSLYWMRFQGQQFGKRTGAHQAAVLQYSTAHATAYPEGVPTWQSGSRHGQGINGALLPVYNNKPIDQLRSASNVNVSGVPDYKLYIVYDIRKTVDPRFQLSIPSRTNDLLHVTDLPTFNNITMKLFSFPLLSQKEQINEQRFCNGHTAQASCKTSFCACPHIVKVDLGALVEMIIIDEGVQFNAVHPIHLHGQYFHVLGTERLGNSTSESHVRMLDHQGHLRRNFNNPIIKDTMQVPDGGYSIIRFYANNPGFWLLHCHIDFHMELGMGMVIQVGERSQMLNPPSGFPRCGEFTNG